MAEMKFARYPYPVLSTVQPVRLPLPPSVWDSDRDAQAHRISDFSSFFVGKQASWKFVTSFTL